MIIANAIAEATSEHEVYFLLTAYLEAVSYGDRHGLLPDNLTRLPVAGRDDLTHRRADLETGADQCPFPTDKARLLMREAREVIGSADDRLTLLSRSHPSATPAA